MEEWEVLMLRIKDKFRRDPKTTWGKNQLLELLDKMHEIVKKEKGD